MRRPRLLIRPMRLVTALTGVSLAFALVTDARANWPAQGQPLVVGDGPAAGSNLKDPANWPNDPGYAGQWNFWSWLPPQSPDTPARTSAPT